MLVLGSESESSENVVAVAGFPQVFRAVGDHRRS